MAKYLNVLVCLLDQALYPAFARGTQSVSPNLVADAYFSALDRVATQGIAKIIVRLDGHPEAEDRIKDMVDVLEISKHLDPTEFARLDVPAKRLKLAERIHSGTLALAQKRGWDPAPFERAYATIVSTGVSLGGPIGKPAMSPDKRHRAQVHYEYDYDIDVSVMITNLENDISRRILFVRLPGLLSGLEVTIGSLSWSANDEVEVHHKNKRDKWIVKLGEPPQCDFITERAARDDPHGLYDLGMHYMNGNLVLKNLERARYWLQRAADRGYSRAPAALAKLDSLKDA